MNEMIFWSPGVSIEDIEKQVILKAFRWYRGNKTQCSIALGISIRTLENKLEKYEQDGQAQQEAEVRDQESRNAQLNRARGLPATGQPQEARILGASAGVHIQSSIEVPAKQPMPVPVGKEVQAVLSNEDSANRKGRRR